MWEVVTGIFYGVVFFFLAIVWPVGFCGSMGLLFGDVGFFLR
jgi:hypothetical protein